MLTKIYLDHSATSPLLPEVQQAMEPYWAQEFGNPSSPHGRGASAAGILRRCRQLCARLLQDTTAQIIFTGGGTEANNLALQGFARNQAQPGHAITTAVEHASVQETMAYLATIGWRVTVLPVDSHGRMDPRGLKAALAPDTRLVSIMWVNNELGTVNPIPEIAQIIQQYNTTERLKIQLHVDAVQAVGRVPMALQELSVDMLTLSGHKVGGPKGVGMLYLRQGLTLTPLLFGGGQEAGLRPGTENMPGIVGFAKALQLAVQRQPQAAAELQALREQLWRKLQQISDIVRITPTDGAPHILHVCIPGVKGEVMAQALEAQGVSAATGSACSTRLSRSPVLDAIGLPADLADGALRFSFGPGLSQNDVAAAAGIIVRTAAEIRAAYAGKE